MEVRTRLKHFFVCEIYSILGASVVYVVNTFFLIIDKDTFMTACESDEKDTTVESQYKNCFGNVSFRSLYDYSPESLMIVL